VNEKQKKLLIINITKLLLKIQKEDKTQQMVIEQYVTDIINQLPLSKKS